MQVTLGAKPAPNSACCRVPSPEVQRPHRERLAERVYQEHAPALRRVASGWIRHYGIGDRVAPDDLVGSTFLIVVRDPRYLGGLPAPDIAAYMSKIVQHQAIMTVRKKRADARVLWGKCEQVRQAEADAHDADPATAFAWVERLSCVYEQLSSEERTLCVYRRAGYEWSEIAEIMNRTPVSLQKRFQRAYSRVRAELSK